MYKDIIDLLSRLGLKNREGRIYLACLANKDGLFIHEIVKETRVIRSTVDMTTKRLTQRGFLTKVKVGRRFRFFAQAPEAILFRQKQLVEDLEQVVPLLSKISGQKKDMEILYFEGQQGFRQVHNDILLQLKFASDVKKDILSFSSGTDFMRLYPQIKSFITKRIKNGSWYRGITHRTAASIPEWSSNAKALRTVKFIGDEAYDFRMDVQIYADNVALYSTSAPVGGVIIRNEKIADSMRALFNLVWKSLPDSAS